MLEWPSARVGSCSIHVLVRCPMLGSSSRPVLVTGPCHVADVGLKPDLHFRAKGFILAIARPAIGGFSMPNGFGGNAGVEGFRTEVLAGFRTQ